MEPNLLCDFLRELADMIEKDQTTPQTATGRVGTLYDRLAGCDEDDTTITGLFLLGAELGDARGALEDFGLLDG